MSAAGIALAVLALPDTRGRAGRQFDWRGTLHLIGGLVALPNVTVAGHRLGWQSPAFFGTAAIGVGLFGTTYLVPVFVQDIAAYNASQAGYFCCPLVSRWRSPSSQLVLFASSSLAFTGAATGFWLLTAWLVIGRAGLGMLIPALNVGVGAVASLSGTELAYASSSVNFVRQLGGAAGVNVLAVLLEWRLGVYGTANGARAFHECFALVTLAFAVAIMPAWSIRKSRR